MFYFGCWGDTGHYLWNRERRYTREGDCPFDPFYPRVEGHAHIDGVFCPKNRQVQGEATVTVKDGWTILAFWDRSVDHRPNSNSAFIERGAFTFEEMVSRAKAEFPAIWARFAFEVRPAEGA